MRYLPLAVLSACAACAPAFATQYLTLEQAQKLMFADATAFREHKLSLAQMREVEKHASVHQVEILTYRESHGGEIRTPAWRRQFVGKSAPRGLTLGDGIANISGATLSASHVSDGVQRIAAIAQVALKP